MTEEEAKTKWCPRAHDGSDQACIGSQCMAWRRVPAGQHQESCGPQGGYKTVIDYEGFCGLAGKP